MRVSSGQAPGLSYNGGNSRVFFSFCVITGYGSASVKQSCKNLGSVVALLQGNFEKSYDFKANFEDKRAVLMRLQKLDDIFLPFISITKHM